MRAEPSQAIIDAVWAVRSVSPPMRLVLMAIAFAEMENRADVETIAHMTNLSPVAVPIMLSQLRKAKRITEHRLTDHRVVYRLSLT